MVWLEADEHTIAVRGGRGQSCTDCAASNALWRADRKYSKL